MAPMRAAARTMPELAEQTLGAAGHEHPGRAHSRCDCLGGHVSYCLPGGFARVITGQPSR